ncbi:hypothetical protein [Frondihabitans cladoniiphilus]|uniref:Uncharacterized protein n=1 Tax=Frondihabitans cladoniiphilus TaxID=715785 RepID=A0ABP8VRU2_9MICO
MAVDGTHPGCFVHATKLYAVPSDSGFTVEQTAASYDDAARLTRGSHPSMTRRSIVGGVLGGLFLVGEAVLGAGLRDVGSLIVLFFFGGVVGFVVAIGLGRQQPRAAQAVVVRLPAVQIPGDVARLSPDDATADELVLWSILTQRFRAAQAALANLPYEQANTIDPIESAETWDAEGRDSDEAPGQRSRAGAGTLSADSSSALAEIAYVTARHDFEPVALLLGLPLAD